MEASPYRLRAVSTTPQRELLSHLDRELFPSDEPEDLTRGDWWILYGPEREPAGFAGIRDVRGEPHLGYMTRAGVVDGHRGKGLQRRLIRVRLHRARARGWLRVVSTTLDNPPASNNLIACGFKLYHPQHEWMCPGTLYWYKNLTPLH